MQLNIDTEQNIDYALKMIKGVENVSYEYKITHPPTERKFYGDKFTSPAINECTHLKPKKFNFEMSKVMKKITVKPIKWIICFSPVY